MASKSSLSEVKHTITISIPQSFADKVRGAGVEIESFVESLIRSLESGAVLIPAGIAKDVKRIWPEFEPDKLPDIVRRAIEVSDTAIDCRVRIDPFYLTFLNEMAALQGVDVKTLISSMVNAIIDNGWLFESAPTPEVLRLTPQELESIAGILGVDKRDVSGSLVAKTLEVLCRSGRQTA